MPYCSGLGYLINAPALKLVGPGTSTPLCTTIHYAPPCTTLHHPAPPCTTLHHLTLTWHQSEPRTTPAPPRTTPCHPVPPRATLAGTMECFQNSVSNHSDSEIGTVLFSLHHPPHPLASNHSDSEIGTVVAFCRRQQFHTSVGWRSTRADIATRTRTCQYARSWSHTISWFADAHIQRLPVRTLTMNPATPR
jgi:hypothetical protein